MPGGTIRGLWDAVFDVDQARENLKNAMDGLGTNEEMIVKQICQLNNAQRQTVAVKYKTAYGEDLLDTLKYELGGNFENVVIAAMMTPRGYDAKEIHDAMCGAGTDETTIVEILCTRSNAEINEIKDIYNSEFESDLEGDLCGETSGYFRRMFVALLAGGRDEDCDVDMDKAAEDAQKFHDAGEACWGTDESELNAVLCLRSDAQLQEMFRLYEEMHGTSIEEAIRSECSGDLQNGYLSIVESAKNKPAYFARRLHDSLAGLGTSDTDLIRIIVSRSEIDLADIKDCYETMYETTLLQAVESDCGGDYKRMLCCLIEPGYED